MKISISRFLVFLISILIASTVMATEEPKFSIIEKSEPFELRAYAPQLIAEVKVEGDLDTASSQGFRLIAAFIFGQNQVSEKISMTVPVGIETAQSTKIAMTVPVGIEASKDSAKGINQWVFSFVMPSEYTTVPGNPVKTCVAKTPLEIHLRQLTAALQLAKVSLLEANELTHTELCFHSMNLSIRSSQLVGTSSPLQTTPPDREAMTDSGQRPRSRKMS
jgi:hypothetical protein